MTTPNDTTALRDIVARLDESDAVLVRQVAERFDVMCEHAGSNIDARAHMVTAMELRCVADWMDDLRAALAAPPAGPSAQTGEDGAPPRVRPTHPLFGGYLKARATIERKGRPSADDFAALHVAEEALNDALYVRATPRAAPGVCARCHARPADPGVTVCEQCWDAEHSRAAPDGAGADEDVRRAVDAMYDAAGHILPRTDAERAALYRAWAPEMRAILAADRAARAGEGAA